MNTNLRDDNLNNKEIPLNLLKNAVYQYINDLEANKSYLAQLLDVNKIRNIENYRSCLTKSGIKNKLASTMLTFNIMPTNSYKSHLNKIKHAQSLSDAMRRDWENVGGDMWASYAQCLLNHEEESDGRRSE